MSEDAEVDFSVPDTDDVPVVSDVPIEAVVVKEGGLEVRNLTRFNYSLLLSTHNLS
jgi:hypothetical protein